MSLKVKYPPVLVRWDDAEADNSWQDEPTSALEATIATTLGFLIRDEANWILVADSYFEKGTTIGNTTKIPRGMIQELTFLNITKKRIKDASTSKPRVETPEVLVT